MIVLERPQDLTRLRRLALSAQGLLQTQPFGRGLAGARRAIGHLGYVQIDTISVVERAHHHVLHSRVPDFEPSMTHQMLLDRDIFEYWAHAAAFLPMADFRFSLPYKHAIKSGQTHWFKTRDVKLMNELLARIRIDGPLRSRDLETDASSRAGWWDWKPAKKALEQLYMQGDLMVSNREGFQKTYDLTERVLPPHVDSSMPSDDEFATHIFDQQLRCHGLISLKGVTYLRRNTSLRKAVKRLVAERLAQRSLEQVQVSGGEIFFMEAGALERRLPRLKDRIVILSPFDNSVIQRERLRALFQYDYQIECYVPADKRRHGYFSLPLLYRDEFVGRMDCKAHRKSGYLEIKSLYLDRHDFDLFRFVAAFLDSIARFCRFQGCEAVSLNRAEPDYVEAAIRSALENPDHKY
ncbi:MAG: hypothetical protein CME36_10110 [unclassified Hahellaceae]|nr:hypothetical protein [Hahellaceae bacterium]|tara:strand:+ start:3631 stop:4854 length:1224 start_codon:yes stop_codon:yes gene_type:complete